MTTTLQKFPFPVPKAGVLRGSNPREYGAAGASWARNWILRNGIFRIRDGVALWEVQDGSEVNCQLNGGSILPSGTIDVDAELGLGLFQYDFQTGGVFYDNGNASTGTPSKDRLLIVTDSNLYYKDLEDTEWTSPADDPATDDFALPAEHPWGGLIGDNGYQTDIRVQYSDIDWDEIETEFQLDNPGETVTHIWLNIRVTETGYAFLAFAASSTSYENICDGVEVLWPSETPFTAGIDCETSGDPMNIGVTFETTDFSAIINQDGYPLTFVNYEMVIVRGAEYDFSTNFPEMSLDGGRDDLYSIRAWDYDQTTHALVASPNQFILDFDGGSSVDISGVIGTCPLAKTISVAGQRIVAGNVSFLDPEATLVGTTYNTIPWAFAHYPDGIVYSDTVLTGGHKVWRQLSLIRLSDSPGEIVASLEMGTMMDVIYKTDAIYVLAVQTGTSPFRPDLRASGIQGPVGPQAVAAMADNLHIFLGRDGALYFFDGSPPRSLGKEIQEWINSSMDNEYAHRSWLCYHNERRELRVMYPMKGSGGKVRTGLILSFDEEGTPVWPIEWDTTQSNAPDWDLAIGLDVYIDQPVILGDMLGTLSDTATALGSQKTRDSAFLQICNDTANDYGCRIYQDDPNISDERLDSGIVDPVTNPNGLYLAIDIISAFRTGLVDMGMPDRYKILTELELIMDRVNAITTGRITASGSVPDLTVKLWAGNTNMEASIVAQQGVDAAGDPPYFAFFRERARYFGIEIAVDAPQAYNFGGALAAIKPLGRIR